MRCIDWIKSGSGLFLEQQLRLLRNSIWFLLVCGLIATFLSPYPIFLVQSCLSPGL